MRAGRAYTVLLICFLVAVVADNVLLVRQNRELKNPTAFARYAAKPGSLIGTIAAVGADSQLREIALSRSNDHFLVISFSPTCPTCQDNQAAFSRLASIADHQGWKQLWLSRDDVRSTAQYGIQNGIPFSHLLSNPNYATYVALHMSLVPQVITLGPGGRIENVWPGKLDSKTEAEIGAFIMHDSQRSVFGPPQDKVAKKEG